MIGWKVLVGEVFQKKQKMMGPKCKKEKVGVKNEKRKEEGKRGNEEEEEQCSFQISKSSMSHQF